MVEKMKYVSITGHISSMNYVVNRYLSRYDIQLSPPGMYQGPQTKPFTTLNPYAKTLQKAEYFLGLAGPAPIMHIPLKAQDAVNLVEDVHRTYEKRSDYVKDLEKRRLEMEAYIRKLEDFSDLPLDISQAESFSFICFTCGRMPIQNFHQYEKFLQKDERTIVSVARKDMEYVWMVYFTPSCYKETVDEVFKSLQFEKINLTTPFDDKKTGNISSLLNYWRRQLWDLDAKLLSINSKTLTDVVGSEEKFAIACQKVIALYAAFDVKKYAALSQKKRIFTFSGWMRQADAIALEADMDLDNLAIFSIHAHEREPPTILKNPPIIRQFEFFTRLYGLPSYGEIDPTPLLAITYTILFGMMFGDVGHGLLLFLLGLYLKFGTKGRLALGGIMAVVGLSATVFGFLYGSIFGLEHIIPALWLRPGADINATLRFAVGVGVVLIAISMCLHMYNALRQRRIGDLLFGANGVAGIVFYASVLFLGVRVFIYGQNLSLQTVLLAVLPLVFVAFKHPLISFMDKPIQAHQVSDNKQSKPGKIGMFIFNTAIEMFETLLTYATNTISFVRVGAFAISHAGMMHVVLQLSASANRTGSILIFILGNVLVMAIEGLLVGIQVLRLDFYEMFSRFYTGGGKGFTSHKVKGGAVTKGL